MSIIIILSYLNNYIFATTEESNSKSYCTERKRRNSLTFSGNMLTLVLAEKTGATFLA